MKKITPLAYFLCLCFIGFGTVDMQAQNTIDKNSIKEWIIANKDKVTLISQQEYKAMSPSVRELVSADSKTIIYDLEVTVEDIKAFDDKNKQTTFIPVQRKEERIADAENKAKEEKLAEKAAKLELYQNDQAAYKKQYSSSSNPQEKILITKKEYDLMSVDKKSKIDADSRYHIVEKTPK